MNRKLACLLAISIAFSASVFAAENGDTPQIPDAKNGDTPQTENAEQTSVQVVIQIINAAGIEKESVAKVVEMFQQDIHFKVAAIDSEEIAANSSSAIAAATAAPQPVAFRVVFWKGESSLKDSLCLLPDAKMVLVDVTPLLSDDPDAEKIERRLIRQTAKGCGLLAGLGYTPGPPCTLKRVSSLKGLDSLSRNFSPPAQGKFDMLLRMEGAEPLLEEGDEEEEDK